MQVLFLLRAVMAALLSEQHLEIVNKIKMLNFPRRHGECIFGELQASL